MNKLVENIKFHISALEKVNSITLEIIQSINDRDTHSVISKIQNRDRLINIVFQFHRTIEEQIQENVPKTQEQVELCRSWASDVSNWSIDQTKHNTVIEQFLISEREATSKEIASIFDKKSRHKGYDLSCLK